MNSMKSHGILLQSVGLKPQPQAANADKGNREYLEECQTGELEAPSHGIIKSNERPYSFLRTTFNSLETFHLRSLLDSRHAMVMHKDLRPYLSRIAKEADQNYVTISISDCEVIVVKIAERI